jgi:hypothetical protein
VPRVVELLPEYLVRLLHPQPLLPAGAEGKWVAAASILLLIALAFAGWRERGASGGLFGPTRTLVLLAAWALGALALGALAGLVEAWYVMFFAALEALLPGTLLVAAGRAWRRGERPIAIAEASLVAVLAIVQLARSPLVRRYDDWQRASVVAERYLEQVESALARARPGGPAVPVPGFVPRFPPPDPGKIGVRSVVLHTDYSIEAWLELTHPDARATVKRENGFVELSRAP